MQHLRTLGNLTITPPKKGFYQENRKRFLALLKDNKVVNTNSVLFLKGPIEQSIYDDDTEFRVVPENTFMHFFGIAEPNTYGVLNLETGKSTVFVKVADPETSFWMKTKTIEEFKELFEVDEVLDLKTLENWFADNIDKNTQTVYLNKGINPYSGITSFNPQEDYQKLLADYCVDDKSIYQWTCEVRVKKSEEEKKLIQQAVDNAIIAHRSVMKSVKEGKTELQMANHFSAVVRYFGNSITPYENIVCAGQNASTLHYSPSPIVKFQKGDMILIDSGARMFGYCSDITRSYPISGKFTEKQKQIYNIVLQAQSDVFAMVKPGVSWQACHIQSEKTILKGLQDLGIVKGDFDEMWEKRVPFYFMPHGLGHYMGLYTHDLPGRKDKENDWIDYDMMYLRVHRKLEEGMVLSNEPGIYFNDTLLEKGYNDDKIKHFFVKEKIKEYQKEVAGVRIEDDWMVTKDGYYNFSQALPKTVEDIEAFMAS